MRRIVILLSVAVVFAVSSMPAALAQDDQSCADFVSQWAAQNHLRQDLSDPDWLDTDGDGVACENWFDYPEAARDEAPAPVGAAAVGTDDGGQLPSTGPGAETLLPAGLVLLTLGLTGFALSLPRAAVPAYEGRHVRRRR